jgi:hypothetical protein
MQTWPRLVATIVIWVAFSIVTTSGNVAASDDSTPIIAIVAAAALFSTVVVWNSSGSSEGRRPHRTGVRARFSPEKLKHEERSRITRLADVLDEEEAAALYEELQARLSVHSDGEVTSLDALLAEREE